MKKLLTSICLMACVTAAVAFGGNTAQAGKITSTNQAQKKALKEIKNAVVTDTETDYEDGQAVYEVTLSKGTKEYDIVYRAKDGKKIKYGWEENDIYSANETKIGDKEDCKKLALKKVKKASVVSISQNMDDGMTVYKVTLKKGNKKYKLEYLAEGKKLIEYEWEITKNSSGKKGYIPSSKAQEIALAKVTGGKVVKCKLDTDDGVPEYEIEIIADGIEYEFAIHAKTGKILEMEIDD